MAKIANKVVPTYDIDHIYVVDSDDDNVIRKMLKEAIIASVTITSSGAVSYKFQVAGENNLMPADNLAVYYDTNAYRASERTVECRYINISKLLVSLGIPETLFYTTKANSNATPHLTPTGYIINDQMMVEAVTFPESWTFTRVFKTVPAEHPEATERFETWEHNANFNGHTTIYLTRADAMKNHKIKILRLDGSESEV